MTMVRTATNRNVLSWHIRSLPDCEDYSNRDTVVLTGGCMRNSSISVGLLLVRVALAIVFVVHGGQKLFVLGHANVTAFLGGVGVPMPAVGAVLLIAAEFGGGLLLLVGLLTRWAAAALAFDMAVAILTVHLRHGFFLPAGYEYALTLFIVDIAVVFTGAGAYSFDAMVTRERTRAL